MAQATTYRTARDMRLAAREGRHAAHTAGSAPGCLQANLVILPRDAALDFMRFCQRNPKPCPLIGVSDTGDPYLRTLGDDIDVRHDLPAYNVYRDGLLDETVTDIAHLWDERMVAFALGCSFTFEHALIAAGIGLWHVTNDTTVPMYRTSVPLAPAGPFGGTLVVSMRMIPAQRVEEAAAISRRFPLAHGGPVHVGDPAAIGIAALERPQWGDPVPVEDGAVPVFWACGVTPQVALERAGLPLVVTHRPGHMLVTDIPDDAPVPVLAHLRPQRTNQGDHP